MYIWTERHYLSCSRFGAGARGAERPVDVRLAPTEVKRRSFCAEMHRNPEFCGKNPIGEADSGWIFARNCEGTEQLQKLL